MIDRHFGWPKGSTRRVISMRRRAEPIEAIWRAVPEHPPLVEHVQAGEP
jgi:hypothetical protein